MIAITRCDSSPVLIHSSYTCLYTYTEYIYYIHIQKYSIIRLQMLPEKRNRSERSMPANCMKFIHQDLLVYVYHSLFHHSCEVSDYAIINTQIPESHKRFGWLVDIIFSFSLKVIFSVIYE